MACYDSPVVQTVVCQGCGLEFRAAGRGRPRRYCSNACRQSAARDRVTADLVIRAVAGMLYWSRERDRTALRAIFDPLTPVEKAAVRWTLRGAVIAGWSTPRLRDQMIELAAKSVTGPAEPDLREQLDALERELKEMGDRS